MLTVWFWARNILSRSFHVHTYDTDIMTIVMMRRGTKNTPGGAIVQVEVMKGQMLVGISSMVILARTPAPFLVPLVSR